MRFLGPIWFSLRPSLFFRINLDPQFVLPQRYDLDDINFIPDLLPQLENLILRRGRLIFFPTAGCGVLKAFPCWGYGF